MLLHAQTAFNIAMHLDDSQQFEGLSDVLLLSNGSFLVSGRYLDKTIPLDGDSMYIAKFNQYGEILWHKKMATLSEGSMYSSNFGVALESLNDSIGNKGI